jgi:UV excision repair protein RAD23
VKEKIHAEKGFDAKAVKLIYSGMHASAVDIGSENGCQIVDSSPGKILKDEEKVETYKIEEKGFVVCMVNKVLPTSNR